MSFYIVLNALLNLSEFRGYWMTGMTFLSFENITRQTDGRTDKTFYRDAQSHQSTNVIFFCALTNRLTDKYCFPFKIA